MDDTNRRGRKPLGPEYVQHLEGSAAAKQRLQVILETMAGKKRVLDACAELDISESRFLQLRQELLQAALERAEGRQAGRPRQTPTVEDVNGLPAELDELQAALATAQIREELALAGISTRPELAESEKKCHSGPGGRPGRGGGRSNDHSLLGHRRRLGRGRGGRRGCQRHHERGDTESRSWYASRRIGAGTLPRGAAAW